MLISINNLLSTRDWWVYGRIKKYLRPIKKINDHEFYDIIDIKIVEELEKKNILRRNMNDNLKKGEQYRIDNITNLIDLEIPLEINIMNLKKEMRKYSKKIMIKFRNHEPYSKSQGEGCRNAMLAHLRHQYTNYEDIIYFKIDDVIKIGNIDKNQLVKKIKDKINNALIRRFYDII